MKKIVSLIICSTALLIFGSCEKLKDLATKDIVVENINFESDEIEVFPAPDGSQAGDFHEFLEKQTIDIDGFEGTAELKNYNSDHIKSVSCEGASLVVYSVSDKAGEVKEFKAVADAGGSSPLTLTIDSYQLGTVYSDKSLEEYISKLVFNMLTQNTPEELTLTGLTNLPETEKLKLNFSIKKITVKIKIAS
ncbi:hypothetical protein FACS1894181_08730 [Bacteroidia bacterium]|nr:hypothetical protein FACS1894181_08730 [Bacteroidia bacterium]